MGPHLSEPAGEGKRYIAEPKLDGQRAQLHVRDHRTVHAFSRPGRELIRLPGASPGCARSAAPSQAPRTISVPDDILRRAMGGPVESRIC